MGSDKNEEYYILFASCIPVKGVKRSVIIDTERENMFFISNEMYDIINDLKSQPYIALVEEYDVESTLVIKNYIDILSQNELGFWTTEPNRFPDISMNWESPSVITNAIIDINKCSAHNWDDIFSQLEELGCKDVQLRYYFFEELDEISRVLNLLDGSTIKSVEILIKYDRKITKKNLEFLTDKYLRIKTLTIHSSPENEVYVMRSRGNRDGMGNIFFVTQKIENNTHCGQINEQYFVLNGINVFTEAKNFNSCLNKKISIDCDGSIKNCPTLNHTYGNVKETRLSSVIDSHFQSYWHINKDQISICKECEFRYVCTDCRGFLENKYDKPKKCLYNPYTLTWENDFQEV